MNATAVQMNQLLMDRTHPDWLTQWQTVLIMKDPQRGAIPYNYRPITCLCTTWKLLSGIVMAKMNRHMVHYMSRAQKGTGNNISGAKHQLLVDMYALLVMFIPRRYHKLAQGRDGGH